MHTEGNRAVRSLYWEPGKTPPLDIMVLTFHQFYVAEIRANMYLHAYQSFVTLITLKTEDRYMTLTSYVPVSPKNRINCC
jgi:hypothetical protein